MTVSLYDAPDGGTLLYSETMPAVQVVGGRFSIQLGKLQSIPAGLFEQRRQVYMGVSVDGSAELPRQQLVTAPYAFVAQSAVNASFANAASGLDCTGCVAATQIADAAVTASKIGAACSPGQILKRLTSGWGCAADEGVVYTAGEGLVLQGTEFRLDTAFSDQRYLNTGEANSVSQAMLQAGSVTAQKIGEPCAVGEVLKKTASGWACAKDDSNTYTGADFVLSGQSCPAGQVAKGAQADGTLLCVRDEGVTYTAGEGLVLQGTEFRLDTAFSDQRYLNTGEANSVSQPMLQAGSVTAQKIGEPCAVGEVLKKTATGWACAKDDSNTYTGADFVLSGQSCPAGQVAKGAQANGTLLCVTDQVNVYTGNDFALSNQSCPPGFVMTGIQSNGLPQCDVDQVGPSYQAGPGIQFDGDKISLLQTCAAGNVLKWNGTALTWECAPDNDTRYLAGTGLLLQNTTFSVDQQQIDAWARDACFDTDNEVLTVVAAAGYMKRGDPLDQSAMPSNGLNEVSNNLLWNQFTDETVSPNVPVPIPDNNPIGVADTLDFPDIGVAEKLWVKVDIETSNTNQIRVYLYDPLNREYLLHDRSGNAQTLKTSYPDPTPTVQGDLTAWVGQNPTGTWRIKVIDTQYLNNQYDGRIKSWSVAIQTLSTKKVRVAGSLYVDNDLTVSGKTYLQGDVTFGGNLTGATGITVTGNATVTGKLAFEASGSPYLDADRVNKLTGGPGAWGMTAGVTYARKCTWTWFQGGTTGINVSSCTPPACGSGHIDLGVNEYARTGALDYDWGWQWTSQTMGTSERLCLIPPDTRATVYVRTCSWANSSYDCNCNPSNLIKTCTPPACRQGDTDLGTQNVVADISKHTDYYAAYDQISVVGWTERLCLITLP